MEIVPFSGWACQGGVLPSTNRYRAEDSIEELEGDRGGFHGSRSMRPTSSRGEVPGKRAVPSGRRMEYGSSMCGMCQWLLDTELASESPCRTRSCPAKPSFAGALPRSAAEWETPPSPPEQGALLERGQGFTGFTQTLACLRGLRTRGTGPKDG